MAEQVSGKSAKPCEVCGVTDEAPQIYKGDPWCSDGHRKVVVGERKPTGKELETMTPELFARLAPGGVRCP